MSHQKRIQPINLTDELASELDSLSAQTGRSKTEIVTVAVQTYLRNHTRWRRDMDKALLDVDAGGGYSGDEVLEWMESWGSDAERPRPAALAKR
jgi:predicted transcriptional regulator